MYNVIVAGSTDFTRDCILQLMELDNVNLNGVIAPIDTKKDRKGNIINSPVVEIALEKHLNLFQPESINKDDFYNILLDLSPDFLIVVAYGKILNKRTLSLPKIMPLNIHGSLLPVLRGASPVEHALLYGFEKSGTTLQKMDMKLDEGDIILQHEVNIDKDWKFNDLYDKIKESGVYLLKEFFKDTDKHISNMIKQDDALATYCSKIKKEDGKPFFDKPVHLTVSGQLHVEPFALALRNVYTFGPTFRAENSNTPRHASEFWMVEPEMAFCDIHKALKIVENLLKYCINDLLKNAKDELNFFNAFVDKNLLERLHKIVDSSWEAIPYTKAVEILEDIDKVSYEEAQTKTGEYYRGLFSIPEGFDISLEFNDYEDGEEDLIKIVNLRIAYTLQGETNEYEVQKLKIKETESD